MLTYRSKLSNMSQIYPDVDQRQQSPVIWVYNRRADIYREPFYIHATLPRYENPSIVSPISLPCRRLETSKYTQFKADYTRHVSSKPYTALVAPAQMKLSPSSRSPRQDDAVDHQPSHFNRSQARNEQYSEACNKLLSTKFISR